MSEISIIGLPLETLLEMANSAYEEVEKSLGKATKEAARCGRALCAAKQQVPHGEWEKWLGANFLHDKRTATRWMALARGAEKDARVLQAPSIRQALLMIADDRATPDEPAVIVVEPAEPEIVEEEPKQDIEPQERPTIRKVSAESRKVPEDRKPRTAAVAAELVEEPAAEDAVVLYLHVDGDAYVVADADKVAAAALQLHEPMALVRMAVLAVEPRDMAWAVDELEQAIKWLRSEIEEAEA